MCGIGLVLTEEGTPPPDLSLLKAQLAKRGPNGSGEFTLFVSGFSLTFLGSVLALRGQEVVTQPLQDDHGNVLLWNGEIFGGIEVSGKENDTRVLMRLLSGCSATSEVVELLETVEGPHAFVYWQAANKRLFFGKDKLGRRSLLLHKPQCTMAPFILSSVADLSVSRQGAPKNLENAETSGPESHNDTEKKQDDEDGSDSPWEELPPHNLYCVDLALEASDESKPETAITMEKLCNGLRLMKLNHRDLFPFGRRMMIDPDSGLEGQEKDTGPDQPYSDATVDAFLHVLKSAVCKRVSNLPSLEVASPSSSRVGILFSGGLDSIILARLADLYVCADEPIDLLNVAFTGKPSESPANGQAAEQTPSSKTPPKTPYDTVPDRQTGIRGLFELRALSPSRQWNFVEVNVTIDELHEHHNQIMQLLHPAVSLMDHSIAAAIWFAARGKGVIRPVSSLLASDPDSATRCADGVVSK